MPASTPTASGRTRRRCRPNGRRCWMPCRTRTRTASCPGCGPLLDAVLRTNYLQDKPWLSLKIDSAAAGEMPAPRPWREIFVHSPRMEGVHLRAGPVARGGIRWSDRREDFRTEILGLMKAQRVKNVGHRADRRQGRLRPEARAAGRRPRGLQAEGDRLLPARCVRGLLDITDNLRRRRAWCRRRSVVRRDGDDPYLVVAADKGTATFSDIANGSPPNTASGWTTPSPRAARPATTTRAWASPRAAPGRWSSATSARSAATSRRERLHLRRRRRHVGRRLRQRHAADQPPHAAGRRLRPPPHLPRPRSRPGDELRRARAAVRPAALVLGRLRPGADLAGRRRLRAQRQVDPASPRGARAARHRGRAR